ncbi:unnamed protein product [Toxocara canis]|uniref:Homeobox domain-containing protein n=1 Tax=Toxocara canis TaxID=6265 RepID=A0A183USE1_TOXCA|nr:unnamed protein product [Toxocara canis]
MSCAESYIGAAPPSHHPPSYYTEWVPPPYVAPYASSASPSYAPPPSTSQQWPTSTNSYHNPPPANTYKWMHVRRTVSKSAAPKRRVVAESNVNRTNFSTHQLTELEKEYYTSKYLNRTRRAEIASILQLNETQVNKNHVDITK